MHMHMHMHMYGFKAVHVMYGFTALKPYISVGGGGDLVQKGMIPHFVMISYRPCGHRSCDIVHRERNRRYENCDITHRTKVISSTSQPRQACHVHVSKLW
jgi:hypothetical protein